MHIQPFELLGVTVSTPWKDIRKRYYELALLCHPDKGGYAEDMILLHAAFKWIEEQMTAMNTQEFHNYEDAQASFDAFVKERVRAEIIPSMMDVALEASGYTKQDISEYFAVHAPSSLKEHTSHTCHTACHWFKQMVLRDIYVASLQESEITFEDVCANVLRSMQDSWETLQPASIPGGYGDYMLTHHLSEQKPPSMGSKTMTVFKEQQPFEKTNSTSVPWSAIPPKLDNYTMKSKTICASDYREAFLDDLPQKTFERAAADVCPSYYEPFDKVDQRLEAMQLERNIMDMKMERKEPKTFGFSFVASSSTI